MVEAAYVCVLCVHTIPHKGGYGPPVPKPRYPLAQPYVVSSGLFVNIAVYKND